MDKPDKINNTVDFEENLRHILSPGPISATGESLFPAKPDVGARQSPVKPTRRLLEAASRAETERKNLFWFKLMRPLALAALIGLLALFAFRATTFGN